MNNNLVEEFLDRVYETRYQVEFKRLLENGSFVRKLPKDLLLNLLNLDNYDFNMYLGFLFKFIKLKRYFVGYEDKIIHISNILINNLSNPNIGILINMLTTTNLIDNYACVEFISMFLEIKDVRKIEAIRDILYSFSNKLKKEDLFKIMNLVKSVNNDELLFQIVHLLSKENITNDRNFNVYFDLIRKNINNPNLMFFIRALYLRNVRELPNSVEIYNRYILHSPKILDSRRKDLMLEAMSDLSITDSYNLKDILKIITTCDERKFKCLSYIISRKDELNDSVFYTLFTELSKGNDIQINFILLLLRNKRIVNDDVQLKFALNFLTKTNEEAKLATFYKIFIIGKLQNESLDSDYASIIQEAILKTNSVDQRDILVDLAPVLKNTKYNRGIINIILSTNNKIAFREYKELLRIPYVRDNVRVLEAMKRLNNCKSEMQMAVIMKIILNEKLFKCDNLFKMIDTVLASKVKCLFAVNYIDLFNKEPYSKLVLDSSPNNAFMKLFKTVLEIKNNYQYELIEQLFNYPNLFKNPIQLGVIEMFILQIKDKYKYDALLTYIKENYSSDFSLLSERSVVIISLIKKCEHKHQIDLLLNAIKVTKGKPNEKQILERIAKVKNPSDTLYFYRLLRKERLLANPNLLKIFDIIENTYEKDKKEAILALVSIERIRNSELFMNYLNQLLKAKSKEQLNILVNIFENNNIKDQYLLGLSEKIIQIEDNCGFTLVNELINNINDIPIDTIFDCLDKIIEYQDASYITENTSLANTLYFINDVFKKYLNKDNDVVLEMIELFKFKDRKI